MSTLYLIRHGQASFGQDNYDKLSDLGKRQSRLLAERLVCMALRFDEIYRGTMTRHGETAAEYIDLCHHQGIDVPAVKPAPGFDEYDSAQILHALLPILFEERPDYQQYFDGLFTDKKSFNVVFETTMFMWCSGKYDHTGITPWREFEARVNGTISAIMASAGQGKQVAVFTSGGPISVAVQRALCLSADMAMGIRQQLVNTALSRFKFTSDQIMMATFNEYPHLESDGKTDFVTYR